MMSYLHSFQVGTPANRKQVPLTLDMVKQYERMAELKGVQVAA